MESRLQVHAKGKERLGYREGNLESCVGCSLSTMGTKLTGPVPYPPSRIWVTQWTCELCPDGVSVELPHGAADPSLGNKGIVCKAACDS